MKAKINVNNIYHNTRQIGIICILLFATVCCEEFVDVGVPKTEITKEVVFSNDASAMSAIHGIYSRMMSSQSFTKGDLERYTGLSSGELINYSNNRDQQQFASASLLSINTIVYRSFWGEAYSYISNANSIIEGLRSSSSVSDSVKNQLEGEALVVRAYCHFYLVNLFGDIPYVTSTDYKINSTLSRIPSAGVYSQIISDLTTAKELMAPETNISINSKTSPNTNAVSALLSRVYLYTSQWELAEAEASGIINNGNYSLELLGNVFISTSRETIWHLRPVIPGTNTPQGQIFILTGNPSSSLGGVSLSNQIYNEFDSSDQRRVQWVGSTSTSGNTYYFPYKYKKSYDNQLTEYSIMLRLAELYLIRAEARAHLNKIAEAKADLNLIRQRAGLPDVATSDQSMLLAKIEEERLFEFFAENGHRWLDLKRTGRVNDVLAILIPGWQAGDAFYPIPQAERLVNPNLSQNSGY